MYSLKELFHRYYVAKEGSQEENYALEELVKWGVSKAGSYPSWMRIILEEDVIFEVRFPQVLDNNLTVVIELFSPEMTTGMVDIYKRFVRNGSKDEKDLLVYAGSKVGYRPGKLVILMQGEVNIYTHRSESGDEKNNTIFILELQ